MIERTYYYYLLNYIKADLELMIYQKKGRGKGDITIKSRGYDYQKKKLWLSKRRVLPAIS